MAKLDLRRGEHLCRNTRGGWSPSRGSLSFSTSGRAIPRWQESLVVPHQSLGALFTWTGGHLWYHSHHFPFTGEPFLYMGWLEKLVCPWCSDARPNTRFSPPLNLAGHRSYVLGAFPLKCPFCPRMFLWLKAFFPNGPRLGGQVNKWSPSTFLLEGRNLLQTLCAFP